MSRVASIWASRLSQFFCGLSGHQLLLNAEPGRLSLKCMSCPYETPGWTIKTKTFDSRPDNRHAVVLAERRPSALTVVS